MKRTKFINLDLMQKQPLRFAAKPLCLGITLAILSSCSSNPESSSSEAQIVQSVSECALQEGYDLETCEMIYKQALEEAAKTAPRYTSIADCEQAYGGGVCVPANSNGSGGSFFMPMMAGFLLANVIDEIGDIGERRRYRNYNPVFYNRYNKGFESARGSFYGNSPNVTVQKDDFKKQTLPPRTISRGGFGSTASSKSNWGGGSSNRSWNRSSSRSWGG